MPPRRMVCKLFSFFSWFRPFEFARHFLRLGHVFRLGGFYPGSQQNVNGRARSRVIDPIARSRMNTHLGDPFADGATVAEISNYRARKARQDSGFCLRSEERR